MVLGAVKEVGGPSFFALLVIAVSFMPIFRSRPRRAGLNPCIHEEFFHDDCRRLAITLDPAIRLLFTHMKNFSFRPGAGAHGKRRPGRKDPQRGEPSDKPSADENLSSGRGIRAETPVVHNFCALLVVAVTFAPRIGVFEKIGSEFMPPLDEGAASIYAFYRPGHFRNRSPAGLADPGQDPQIVSGSRTRFRQSRAGQTATDPAPLSMMETVIVLRPQSEWPKIPTWYSDWAPEWLKNILCRAWPDHPAPKT